MTIARHEIAETRHESAGSGGEGSAKSISGKIREHSLTALLDALGRNRRALIVIYLAVMSAAVVALFKLGPAFPEWVHSLRGVDDEGMIDPPELDTALALLVVFLAAHLAFLWGGGRVTLSKEPAGVWRLIIPVGIVAAMLAVISWSVLAAVLDMFDRLGSEGSLRGEGFLNVLEPYFDDNDGSVWPLFAASWLVWFVIGIYFLRASDHSGALGRLLAVLLAGSWLEFLIALPVDIAVRERAGDCPCATGSWMALLVAIPVCLFVFGPGLVLLYLRELRIARKEPSRVLRVLVRKSRPPTEAA